MTFLDRVAVGVKAALGGAPYVAPIAQGIPSFADSTLGLLGPSTPVSEILGMSPAALWRSQPHLRTVVDFLARNIAQLSLHTFTRESDGGRQRVFDGPAAAVLSRPNPTTTSFELIRGLVADMAVHDEALWQVVDLGGGQWNIYPIPASWIAGRKGGTAYQPEFWVVNLGNGKQVDIPANECVHFHGWDPISVGHGTSPVMTLKQILAEQVAAQRYRQQVWDKGGRVNLVLTRPAGAPEWTLKQKERFRAMWRARYSGPNAADAGGTPVLEDGMTAQRLGFSAQDDQFVENNKLALATVAQVYHINPTMIGSLDNANYSNVREFRRSLYGDTLGPTMAFLEARINTFLLPMMKAPAGQYVEFNIGEKLQGSFEEQAAVAQASVGAPFMTVNEYRAMRNLPAVAGGDELLTPLNMSALGAAIPADDPSNPDEVKMLLSVVKALAAGPAAPVVVDALPQLPPSKAKRRTLPPSAPSEAHIKLARATLAKVFARQRADVLGKLGSKAAAPDWWDTKRWDKEMGDALFGLALAVATEIGVQTAAAMGFDPDDYDQARTVAFLKAVAASRAGLINGATQSAVQEAIDDDEDEEHTPAKVFDAAESDTGRGYVTALTLVTTLTGFAVVEAGKQLARDTATKTWRTTSANPRAEHKRMNGETVPIDSDFSNGAAWAGDPKLGADGVAGCRCIIDITIPE